MTFGHPWCCSGAIEHSAAGTKFSEMAFYCLSSLAFLFSVETSVCRRNCWGIVSGPWSLGIVVLLITERNTFVFLPLTDLAGLGKGAGGRCLGQLVYQSYILSPTCTSTSIYSVLFLLTGYSSGPMFCLIYVVNACKYCLITIQDLCVSLICVNPLSLIFVPGHEILVVLMQFVKL